MNGSITVVETISAELSLPVSTSGSLAAEQGVNGSMSIPPPVTHYSGSYEVTPSGQEQTLETGGLLLDNDVTIHAIPPEYVVPSGTMTITENDSYDVTTVAGVVVDVQPELQSKSRTYTPTESQQTETIEADTGYDALSGVSVTVQPIPEEYIVPEGSQTVTENGEYDVASLAEMVVDVEPTLQSKTRTYIPIDAGSVTEVITADGNYDGLDQVTVTVEAIPTEQKTVTPSTVEQVVTPSSGKYLTEVTVEAMPSQRLQAKEYIVDHAGTETITADSGYAGLSEVAVNVPQGEIAVTSHWEFYTENGARKWRYRGEAYVDTHDDYGTPGFIENETVEYGSWTSRDAIPTGTSVTPTESSQTIGGANTMMEGSVTVEAIPNTYVGSGITRRDDSDLYGAYEDGAYQIGGLAGYYQYPFYKTVPPGTEGTPTATKGAVSNHSVSVTPSVTNAAGYITGGTKNGTAVTVEASELVSGTKSITQNGTGIDVADYESVDVAVEANLLTLDAGFLPSTEVQTRTYTPVGFDGYDEVNITVSAVSPGSQGTPVAIKGEVSSNQVLVTPKVTNYEGYIEGGTLTGLPVGIHARDLVSGTYTVARTGSEIDVSTFKYINVAEGTAGTPTATKGSVSNHSVTVTPSVTNLRGWISDGTLTGDPVTVSASELVSGTKAITQSGNNIDVANYAAVNVPTAGQFAGINSQYITIDNARKWRVTASTIVDPEEGGSAGWIDEGVYAGVVSTFDAIPANTIVAPTESAQTIGGANYMMEGAVTVYPIPSNYQDIPKFTVDFTASPATARCNKTYSQCVDFYNTDHNAGVIADVKTSNGTVRLAGSVAVYQLNAYILYAVYTEQGVPAFDLRHYPSGTITVENPSSLIVQAGTPTATKGSVTNHSISVTPSVTNPAGYIDGGTKNGTAVTVTASELVSGSLSISSNDTYDVTNYAEVVVDVSSGVDGNNLAYGTGSYLVGTAKVGTAYAWTDYQGSNIGIINKAIVGTDAVV